MLYATSSDRDRSGALNAGYHGLRDRRLARSPSRRSPCEIGQIATVTFLVTFDTRWSKLFQGRDLTGREGRMVGSEGTAGTIAEVIRCRIVDGEFGYLGRLPSEA